MLLTFSYSDASSDTEIIKKLLGRGYDWRVRPPGINLTIPGKYSLKIQEKKYIQELMEQLWSMLICL